MNMNTMHNPAHPGKVLRDWIPEGVSISAAAKALHINRVTLSNLLNGRGNITANMALRLSAWLGTSAEMWVGMQAQWDLWQTRQQPSPVITPISLSLAETTKAAHA
jgi:addiction module HigA family antidote